MPEDTMEIGAADVGDATVVVDGNDYLPAAELAAREAKIERRCAGGYVLEPAQRESGFAKLHRLAAGSDLQPAVEMVVALDAAMGGRVPPATLSRLTSAPALDVLSEAAGYCLNARKGCGADLQPTILAPGFDGEEHEATCPKCGEPFDWRAACSAEAASAKATRRAAALAKALE